MSVLLYVAYLVHCGSPAISTPIPTRDLSLELFPSSNTSSPPQFDQRDIWDILWGCLATLFACSWVSVHPNVPPPDTKWPQIALTRFELMVWTIKAPEAIILFAANQWIAARQLKKKYQDKGWTITHGFFIQMGGFMLFDGDTRKGVLSPERFEDLINEREIAFPKVTLEEIEDRSKGDGLSKGLVLVQAAWFIVQLVTRTSKGLAVTQLELATSGFAALNGSMYFFWWNKPLSIQLPIPVHLLHPTAPINEDVVRMSQPVVSYSLPKLQSDTPGPEADPLDTADKQKISFTTKRRKWNLWPSALLRSRKLKSRFLLILANPDYRLLDAMSVPIFFVSEVPRMSRLYGSTIASVMGMIFGAIHCAGWNFIFPSSGEGRIWKIASVIITGYPAIFLLISLPQIFFQRLRIDPNQVPPTLQRMEEVGLFSVCLPIYIVARAFILVEAFLALRNLPVSATYAVQWTTFLPHI